MINIWNVVAFRTRSWTWTFFTRSQEDPPPPRYLSTNFSFLNNGGEFFFLHARQCFRRGLKIPPENKLSRVIPLKLYALLNIYAPVPQNRYGLKFQLSPPRSIRFSIRPSANSTLSLSSSSSNISSTGCNNIYIFPCSNYPRLEVVRICPRIVP